jgi:branched-chain amino acid transport system ATP-binding protein
MLSCEAVSVTYGPVRALHGVTLEVQEHEVVAVVGANGAGKSTLLRAIMGLVRVQRGRILFCGRDLLGRRPYEITRLGVAMVPEGRRVFAGLTVEENLDLGGVTLAPAARRERLEEAYRWFPVLAERRRQPAGSLSGGEQQMLAIARGLMSAPRLLLVDEPSLGLSPRMVRQVGEAIAAIRARGTTILLAEQNAQLALRLASRAYVLQVGRVALAGDSRDLLTSPDVRRAYLGVSVE